MALIFLLLPLFVAYGSLDAYSNNSNSCIEELPKVNPNPITLNLSNPSKISPNYSVATSVQYHNASSTILIGGDFFYIDPKDTSNRTYYRFVQAFTHSTDNKLTLKYSKSTAYSNPSFGNKLISHKSLRSWTRIIAHPTLPYFYVLGINNLTQYNVNNGQFMWTAYIPPCSSSTNNADRPIIYNDATFLSSDAMNIYVGGSCVDSSGKTVVVLDSYSVQFGKFDSTFRQLYNLTDIGFFKDISILDGFGLVPPEITISAPINPVTTSIVDKYFYVGFSHLLFIGMARIEHNVIDNDWRVEKWLEHWTLVNPSFVTHKSLVTTKNGIVSLLDPSIDGVMHLFEGKMRHFQYWKTKKIAGQITEHNEYSNFTWYGGHEKYDLHLDWTLSVDALSDYKDVYVTTAPLELPTVRTSTIAKHEFCCFIFHSFLHILPHYVLLILYSVHSGEVIGGALIDFYATDSIVTNDGQLIVVGFEWTPNGNEQSLGENDVGFSINTSQILPYFERKAVFQMFENEPNEKSNLCIGCEVDHFGTECENKCDCNNGYCNDGLDGQGNCYCTISSYGEHCYECGLHKGTCDPMIGLCNSGPDGDGTCKFCYSLEIDIGDNMTNSSIDFGLGDHYGPLCKDECKCNTKNGICFTSGDVSDERAGHCIYCTDSNYFGADCDEKCECDSQTEYCSNGVSGTGCIKYDYGGLLKGKSWEFYVLIASALFVVLFSITWWQTNKQFKAANNGKSIPWCPQREKNVDEDEDDILKKDEYKANDLREHMIKQQNIQNGVDPNEPPAVSHNVYNGSNNNANGNRPKYDI